MSTTLHELCKDWQNWAVTADRSEDGWQSDYPQWDNLMYAAKAAMLKPSLSVEDLQDIELCWTISDETEDLAEYAIEHLDQCWEVLNHLAQSSYLEVRWQVFYVLSFAGRKAEPLLRRGLADPNPYCKRRAFLSLVALQPDDAKELAEQFMQDEDVHIRNAAAGLMHSRKVKN
jgi:hypothetical protein